MSRQEFLERVRRAAEAGRAYRVDLREIPPDTGYVGAAQADLCAAVAHEVDAVGGQSHLVDDDRAALAVLDQLFARYAPSVALCWRHEVLSQLGLAEFLRQRNVAMLDGETLASEPGDRQRERALAAQIGITSADWVIAETGTLVLRARPGHERIASLLPPVHVAIVRRNQIVPDLLDVFEELKSAGLDHLPSHVTLVTGPSKTGDIELQLTTGVHGPGHWHVIVIGGEPRTL